VDVQTLRSASFIMSQRGVDLNSYIQQLEHFIKCIAPMNQDNKLSALTTKGGTLCWMLTVDR